MSKQAGKAIGGFLWEESTPKEINSLLAALATPEDDVRHMMSGRCAITLAIEDWMRTDTRQVAYLPAYTCETVSGCFEKKGYRILYYDVDKQLQPLYDETVLDKISLFLACGYFGFPTFTEEFADSCAERGIGVITDATHSVFTKGGIPAASHYVACSFRKWLGVPCGGLAVKKGGSFAVEATPPHQQHVQLRYSSMEMRKKAMAEGNTEKAQQAVDLFWKAELLLRQVYEAQSSDAHSAEIISHYPVNTLVQKRRLNYETLLADFPKTKRMKPVFPALEDGVCPSHFSIYCEGREQIQQALLQKGIHTTVYWPVPPFIKIEDYPNAQWVYEHILSLPCDQRYTPEDMRAVALALGERL